MNKKIVLDFEARFDQFKSKMKEAFEEVSKTNDKFLGKGPNTGSMSDLQRNRYEQERLAQSREKFYASGFEDERRGKINPFSEKGKQFLKQEEEFEKHDAALKENSEQIKRQNIEESVRHKEYRSLSDKELKQRAEELRTSSKKALETGDIDKAEALQQELQSIQAAKKWRDQVGGKEVGSEESQQMKFMRQTARNMFLNDLLGGGTQILGHGTNMIAQTAQTGFQGYSAASASGMGGLASAGIGTAIAAIGGLIKLFSGGEDLLKAQNKLGGVTAQGRVGNFGGMENVGIGGIADREMMLERARSLAKETGSGYNLAQRTRNNYLLQRSMGLEGGETRAFTQFERGKENMGTGEGVLMFTKMLEKLNTGVIEGGPNKDLSKLPKYLEKLLIINEKTFQVTGELNKNATKSNMAFLGGATGLGGIFAHERNASDLISGIQSSFANPGDELMKFHNIRAIRETQGNLSPAEIIKMSENMNDSEVFNKRYQNLKLTYGGVPEKGSMREASFISDLQNQNNISSFTKAEQLMKEMEASGGMMDKKTLDKFMKPGEGENKAESILTKTASGLTTSVERLGSQLGNAITDLASAVRSLAERFGAPKTTTAKDVENKKNKLKSGADGKVGTKDDLTDIQAENKANSESGLYDF